ncbi:MAG: beta-propeller fold lactonase family protein [Treponema sp.]|jgi:YVTN family beta-propeller protein|nr:beta-propeller fold lactonase family protein [Treponema sp.]
MMQIKEILKILILGGGALMVSLTALSCDSGDDESNTPKYGTVYISNTGSATVSVIDLNARKVTKTIDLSSEVEGAPAQSHFISVTKDGRYLWVGERQGSADGKVLVVDTASDEVVKTFNVGAAIGQHLSRNGKWLFSVSNNKGIVEEYNNENFNGVINVFDVENQTWLGKINHGSAPHVLDTSPDSNTLWTTTAGGGQLVSYDISGLPDAIPNTPTKTINVFQQLKDREDIGNSVTGVTLHALAVHPNGRHVIVGSFDSGLTTGGGDVVVDIQEEEIVARVAGRPHNYDISPDKRYLLSGESSQPDCEEEAYLNEHQHTGLTGPIVRLVDIDALTSATAINDRSEEVDWSAVRVSKTIDAGALGTGGVNHQAYDPTGDYIIVAASGATSGANGRVLIIKSADLSLVVNLEVGKVPHGVVSPGYGR